MKLIQAIQPQKTTRLAFVGAGGKTSSMFQLARQLEGPVLVTASTHLGSSELSLADQVVTVQSEADLTPLQGGLADGVTLLIGPQADEAGRQQGLTLPLLEKVRQLADANNAPLLIEADGSRRLPLKAPAEHEPVIPPFVDTVVVVAGINGIGQPLGDEWVHRPQLFAGLSGLALDQPVTKAALAEVLVHPEGGLKGIPAAARRFVLLTHADSPQAAGVAHAMWQPLSAAYEALLVADMQAEAAEQVVSAHRKVAGVVLAAGGSDRFGQPKQLLDWHGQPFVRVVAQTALAAGLQPVVVVSGRDHEQVEAALEGLDVSIVHNPAWADGQSTSVRAGLAAVPPQAGAAIFLMVDQPHIPAELVQSVCELHASTLAPVVAPMVDGRRGNPVLFDRQTFADLAQVSGDSGGRQIFSKYRVTLLPWVDSMVGLDVDTPDDYQRLLGHGKSIQG